MKCPYCMEEIADDSQTCALCQSPLVKPCPFCLEKIQADAIKCRHCGSMLSDAPPASPAQPAPPHQPQYGAPSAAPYQAGMAPPPPPAFGKVKDQTTAAILCALLGGFGAHRFYLGPLWTGIAYLLLCWTSIPSLIAVVEAYIITFSSRETWARKYNNGVLGPPVHIAVKILVLVLPALAIIGILSAIAIPQFAAYRTKSYNAEASSSLKNLKTSLESSYADNQKYPETIEASGFKVPENVYVKCTINPEAYVCSAAHKNGTIMYTTDSAAPKIAEQPYTAGDPLVVPYDPPVPGAAKADDYSQAEPPAPASAESQMQQPGNQMTFSPSFDCAKASTGAERMICSNSELAQADVELAQAYRDALARTGDKRAFKKEHEAWRRQQRDACSTAPEMLQVYHERIAQLGMQ